MKSPLMRLCTKYVIRFVHRVLGVHVSREEVGELAWQPIGEGHDLGYTLSITESGESQLVVGVLRLTDVSVVENAFENRWASWNEA